MKLLEKILLLIFGTNANIATIVISMLPIIELKGAIPIGMSTDIWQSYALTGSQAFVYSLIGSCLVVPIIALTFMPILHWFSNTKLFKKAASVIKDKVQNHCNNIKTKVHSTNNKNKTLLKCVLLFLFVAVPLPLTGVWTGTCVGVVIGLKFWQILLSVIGGNIIAGLIIYFVLSVFPALTTILAITFIIIAITIIAYLFLKIFILQKQED